MKMLKRLFQFSRKPWRVGRKPEALSHIYSAVAPDEFARLLGSGRTKDLKILARKLSGPTRVKI